MARIDTSLAELVMALPPEAQESVRDFVEFLLVKHDKQLDPAGNNETDDVTIPVDERRSAMMQEVEAYHRLHPELLAEYEGQHVAIYQGRLVDHDPDPDVLVKRTLAHFPGEVVLQRQVEASPETILNFRSPRLVSNPTP